MPIYDAQVLSADRPPHIQKNSIAKIDIALKQNLLSHFNGLSFFHKPRAPPTENK
jgi:hypothetical protein